MYEEQQVHVCSMRGMRGREGLLCLSSNGAPTYITPSPPPPSYPQVLVFERGPLVFVFNWSPTKDYEGYKVRRGKGGKGYKVRGAGAGRGGRKGGGGRVMRGGADEEALCRPE